MLSVGFLDLLTGFQELVKVSLCCDLIVKSITQKVYKGLITISYYTKEVITMTTKTTKIHSEKECDFCNEKAEYDGKTRLGAWAYMCETHFKKLGVGLGTGKGQKLEVVK